MDKKDLEKINALTRREFTEEELYTFPVTLCGNEIDRDGERFSDAALEQMAALFIGKTIIRNHDADTSNQVARIYDTELVETDVETSYGAPYKYLKGYAYTVRTDSNADFITEIDAGIKREVSVACSAGRICSVCGKDVQREPCEHVKGQEYDGKLCHHILDGVSDAYELSFVAVPAQPDAGVTAKSFTEGGNTMEDFTPITTKAAFDSAAQPLIDAAVTAKAAEYEGWLSPEGRAQLETAHKAELRKAYCEKAALLYGLPGELAERLTGETQEDIEKDAQLLAGLTKSTQETPHFQPETPAAEGMEGELLEMLRSMRNA